ncbi:hypothetical protein HpCK35_17570 [Helicobacter pylori]
MKNYQKLLGASCLALYLVGCGSGGGGESPVEMTANSEGAFQISSKADSVTIQGVKLNRGNCVVNFVPVREAVQMGVLIKLLQFLCKILKIWQAFIKNLVKRKGWQT